MSDSEDEKNELFAELYTRFKETLVGHKFRLPKKDGDYWKELVKARKMIDEMGGNYGEFLTQEFRTYEFHSRGRRRRLYPAAKWLTLPVTRARYAKFLNYRKSDGLSYSTGGGWFTVRKTGKRYPIEVARCEVRQDEVASEIYSMAMEGAEVHAKYNLWRDCCYLIAKMEYRGETIAPVVYNWILKNVKGVIDSD